jgi:hypothetical protein
MIRGKKMGIKKALIPVLVCALALCVCACDYIVLPEEEDGPLTGSEGWGAVATNVGKSDAGDLHIDITIQNNTGVWSAMQAVADKPAVLTTSDGKTTNCDTVFVSTGGHRLAPGFQMRGFTAGTKAEPETQLICVECKGAEADPGSKLSIDYSYVTGQYNYYEPEANKADGKLEIDLDQVATDLTYPIASPIEGLIQKPSAEITALNKCVLTLTGVERTNTGLRFAWQTSNPGEYPTYVHIGTPPVIGEDGIIYGLYETPDLTSVPITPAGGATEWTTEVAAPKDAKGFYILLSVESGKARLYANYAVDITDQ